MPLPMKLCNANVCFMFSLDKVFYVNNVLMQIIWFQYRLQATNILSICLEVSVKWTPCQNGTVHSQVVGGSSSLLVRVS